MTRFYFWSGLTLTALVMIGCGDGTLGEARGSTSAGSGGNATASGVGVGGGAGGYGGSGGSGGYGGSGGINGSASSGVSPCPPDMALANGFCIDRWEAPNQPGEKPLVMQSALLAGTWCAAHGKRLCTEDEWTTACEGPSTSTYPYGDTHVAGRCNDDKTWKVVNEGVLATWPSPAAQTEVDKLWQGSPSGEHEECVSGHGVFDMTGNIEEWVVRTKPSATSYPHVLKGCYWAGCFGGSKPTCQSRNTAHADGFMFYETGFRCCGDLLGGG
jgi:hypothetical protein